MTDPPLDPRLDRLLALGLPELVGVTPATFIGYAARLPSEGVLALHPSLVPAATLARLLQREGKPGFVVVDMTDLEEFVAQPGTEPPDAPLYVLEGLERGDDLLNCSPNEALPELVSRGRSPLTVHEGISWLLQQPEVLEPNRCFMTIGSRKPAARGKGLDSRTPAIWISNGTGRDGMDRNGAPKVGWCWAGNRHTWLGFASVTGRLT